jgi:hypothetical protein
MPHTNDPDAVPGDAEREACLRRTRVAVLNVLMGVGLMIAVSGWLLRRRAEEGIVGPSRRLHDALLTALYLVGIVSYLVRRVASVRAARVPMAERGPLFYGSRVATAALAALGVPLGLAYGWWVDSRLEAVIPFWVVPLALGLLAIPRRAELDDITPSTTSPEAPPQ